MESAVSSVRWSRDGGEGMIIVSDSVSGKPKGNRPERRSGRTDPVIAAAIGQKLRSMYDGMLSEPVPPDLADLVRRLSGDTDGKKTGS